MTKTFISNQIEPGSDRASLISIVATSFGTGTLTIPYIVSINGLIGGPLWIFAGALLTFYSSRLLVH